MQSKDSVTSKPVVIYEIALELILLVFERITLQITRINQYMNSTFLIKMSRKDEGYLTYGIVINPGDKKLQ